MELTDDVVRHVARLAALEISDDELESLKNELSDILGYVAQLSEVDTSNVQPTSHVHGVVNAFRDDLIRDSLPIEKLEQLAPDFSKAGLRVPKII